MTSILIALAVVALVVYGLERNHQRQLHLGSRLAGSAQAGDRDAPRVLADLRATAAHSTPNRADQRRRAVPVRPVHPVRSA
ncbi:MULTISPECIES: hypothetical protein [Saccharothrix]|uniref:hypothetical protein n=1 Tax=Saccharothrix TaxID=2071 RepID=UPI00093F277F|nr:hypothetical protein [Saccharothrix sp. CB00851]OKI14737.1 hypothetical protein A6A25_14860 [Saccharothrix sp. CB00851]